MKYYVVEGEDLNLHVIGSSSEPIVSYGEIDKSERGEWLQIESIDHGDGNGKVDTVTINQVLKDQILADELAADLQGELDEEGLKNEIKSLKTQAKAFNKEDLGDLDSIKNGIDLLYKMILAIEKKLLNLE